METVVDASPSVQGDDPFSDIAARLAWLRFPVPADVKEICIRVAQRKLLSMLLRAAVPTRMSYES